jgi:hypothetical protein
MKLSREELKEISAGATAQEYGSLLLAFILKVIAAIKAWLNPPTDTGGGGTGGDDGSGSGQDGGGDGPGGR